MKQTFFILIAATILFLSSCFTDNASKKSGNAAVENDSIIYVKKPFADNPDKTEFIISVLKESNNVRHGIQKRFYRHGSLYSKTPFKNGVREGVTKTYYPVYKKEKPKLWKEQPYVNGKLNGICTRYHKNGQLQSEYEYKNGLPAIGLKEYSTTGKMLKQPELQLSAFTGKQYHEVTAKMSNNTKKVKFYLGELVEGRHLSPNAKELVVEKGEAKAFISVTATQKSATITAVMVTRYGNRLITAKTVKLK